MWGPGRLRVRVCSGECVLVSRTLASSVLCIFSAHCGLFEQVLGALQTCTTSAVIFCDQLKLWCHSAGLFHASQRCIVTALNSRVDNGFSVLHSIPGLLKALSVLH